MATNYKFERLNAGRDYIADNYQAPLSLSGIAKHSYMSPYNFLRVFKENYGETPNEFLLGRRILVAQKFARKWGTQVLVAFLHWF